MFEGKPPQGPMMDDMPAALRSLQRLREVKPTAVHFCHDKRTWMHKTAL